jgi:hypothetical protein
MYPGWMIIGASPVPGEFADYTEIINSTRAYAYADYAGICWLNDCSECDAVAVTTPGYPYTSPITDPAPWYDQYNPDSWGFLGVIGLDVSGADDSTRQASVHMSINGPGVIGPTYMAPRTMVVRALAIATDECSLQFGLTWLRQQYNAQHDPCGGDTLTFYDCCPCICGLAGSGGPCWAESYGELKATPPCLYGWWPATYQQETAGPPDSLQYWPSNYGEESNPTGSVDWWPDSYEEEGIGPTSIFWPDTYQELVVGPPNPADDWCSEWVDIYRELRMGPSDFSCCIDGCVLPYMRQFYNSRVTEGPTVLQKPVLNANGAVAEIEFTIVSADPVIHAMPTRVLREFVEGATPAPLPTPEPPIFHNPYRPAPLPAPVPPPLAASWVRDTLPIPRMEDQVLNGIQPYLRVAATERSGPVRIGLWSGDHRLGGYTIPYVAEHSAIQLRGREAYYSTPDGYARLAAFVRDWDGRWPKHLELPHGEYTLTVDQDADNAVRLLVDVSMTPIGSG